MSDVSRRVTALLYSVSGAAGPLGSTDDDDAARAEMLAGDPPAVADAILRALEADLPATVHREDLEAEAADLLAELADDAHVLQRILEGFAAPATRPSALDAVALSAAEAAAPLLHELVIDETFTDWSDRDVVKLVSALGSLRSPAAADAIRMMRRRDRWSSAVQRELDRH